MESQLDNWDSTASLLAWIRLLICRELPHSSQGQTYANQLLGFVTPVFEPGAKLQSLVALPELCCQANHGQVQFCRPIVAAWSLLLLAARVLDDIEDGEVKADIAIAINTTTGLHFIVQLILNELGRVPETAASFQPIILELDRAMLHACAGQHADLVHNRRRQKELDPDGWLEIARAKSGGFFAWAAKAGARVANATESVLADCYAFGHHLGTLLQMADDFNDVWLSPQSGDLVTGSLSLPVVYARFVSDSATRNRLDKLISQAESGDIASEDKIRQILIEVGAQKYLLIVARAEYLQALAALKRMDPAREASQALLALLDQIFPTVNNDGLSS